MQGRARNASATACRKSGLPDQPAVNQSAKNCAGQKTDCIEPLFPGYLFVQLDTNTANFNALRSTRGVNGFVRFGGVPTTVPTEIMDSVIALEQTLTGAPNTETLFKTGDTVQITEGPFAGLEAIYSMAKGEERCLVFLDMLGKQQQISIEETALRPSL